MGIADTFFDHMESCHVCQSDEDSWCTEGRKLLDAFAEEITGEAWGDE